MIIVPEELQPTRVNFLCTIYRELPATNQSICTMTTTTITITTIIRQYIHIMYIYSSIKRKEKEEEIDPANLSGSLLKRKRL